MSGDELREQMATAIWDQAHAEDAVKFCTEHKWAATRWRRFDCPRCIADAAASVVDAYIATRLAEPTP